MPSATKASRFLAPPQRQRHGQIGCSESPRRVVTCSIPGCSLSESRPDRLSVRQAAKMANSIRESSRVKEKPPAFPSSTRYYGHATGHSQIFPSGSSRKLLHSSRRARGVGGCATRARAGGLGGGAGGGIAPRGARGGPPVTPPPCAPSAVPPPSPPPPPPRRPPP